MKQVSTLAEVLASAPPDHPAVILPEDGFTATYRQLNDQVDRLALALIASGLKPGHTVAYVLPNGLENVALFLAITPRTADRGPAEPRLQG